MWLAALADGYTASVFDYPPSFDTCSLEYRTIHLNEGERYRLPGIGNVKVPMTGYYSVGDQSLVWLGDDETP